MTDRPAEPDSARPEAAPPVSEAGSEAVAEARSALKQGAPYRVLARKYRPERFADLIGQEALVRTLGNAIRSGRVAHAFILTGVRGVGKTTSARIIARALNCVGPDGTGGPTPEPCGSCEHCRLIAEDRHVDVIEMDAASRTGIGDIRELIEGVRYRPVQARNKVYIIDEVHMLSTQAFNGLLKTLEEPPEHVVFIFATTEIRKVPITVLSRCQRFDLRRVEQETLAGHFARILEKEGVEAEEAALAMIARAADGSVRDGLSLLDQAIALSASEAAEGEPIRLLPERVKEMLGLADRARTFDLYEALLRGQVAEALDMLGDLHAVGADPAVLLQDLLELTHFLTRVKVTPALLDDPATPEHERAHGRELMQSLDMASLARTWQILLKGLSEVRNAPRPLQAAEMVLVRLAYASNLPTPADLVKRLESQGEPAAAAPARPAAPSNGGGSGAGASSGGTARARSAVAGGGGAESEGRPVLAMAPAPEERPETAPEPLLPQPRSYEEVVELARTQGERQLASHLARDVHLVRFEPGRIELRTTDKAPARLTPRLKELLSKWTGAAWAISVSNEEGQPTLQAQKDSAEAAARESALAEPLVKAVMESFPGARLVNVSDPLSQALDEKATENEAPNAGVPPAGPAYDMDGEAPEGEDPDYTGDPDEIMGEDE